MGYTPHAQIPTWTAVGSTSAYTHYQRRGSILKNYLELPQFMTDAEKQDYLHHVVDGEFIVHKSSQTGKPSVLKFYPLPVQFRHIERSYLLAINPNDVQGWHVDSDKLRRNSVLIHPISDNYAPCSTEDGDSSECIIMNTQARHAVFNNDSTRVNLQIPLDYDYDEFIDDYAHPVWGMILSLYPDHIIDDHAFLQSVAKART